jgi:hypothetical protein
MFIARPSRRQVLTIGALSGVGFAVGGFLWLPDAAENQAVLSAGELGIVAALGEVLFPEGNAIGFSWKEVDLAQEVDRLLAEVLDPKVVAPFRYLLRFVQYGCGGGLVRPIGTLESQASNRFWAWRISIIRRF